MNKVRDKIFSFIINNSTKVLLFSAIIVIAASVVLPRISIDNNVDVFFDKESPSFIGFEQWKDQFGSDEVIIIAFSDNDIFTADNLKLISSLTEKLEEIDNVDNVTSLTTVNNIIGFEQDFIVEKLIEEIPSDENELNRVKQEALSNPLYVKNVISVDGKTTAIFVEIEHIIDDSGEIKKKVIEDVQSLVDKELSGKKKYYFTGLTAIEYFYALYMQDDLKTFVPGMFLMMIFVLYICFKRTRIVIVPLIAVTFSIILTMCFFYFCGFSINNVTTVIPPILMAIAIASSIHIVGESIQRRYRYAKKGELKKNLLMETISHLWFPCFLTIVTTSVGFFSLTVSKIPPVKELGIVVGVGVFFALMVTFTVVPALMQKTKLFSLEYCKKTDACKKDLFGYYFQKFLNHLADFNSKNRKAIIVATIILLIVSVIGIYKIKVETSTVEYFKKQSPVYIATEYVEDNLTGVHTLNLSLQAKSIDYFKSPKALKDIEKLKEFLYSLPQVDKVISVADYIKEINKSFHNEDNSFYSIPDSKELIAQYLLLYGADDLENFVDSNWQWSTVEVRLKEHSTVKLANLLKVIKNYLDENFKNLEQKRVLGQTVLEVETNNAVTQGQIQSLGLAMCLIFFMMFIVFRSVSVGIVSIIPNLLPILVNFGIMGWLGIKLDSATSMISAIGIGIIVDDTIHFLHCFGQRLKENKDYDDAMRKTLQIKGRPISLTSVLLALGFGIVVFSKFVPSSYFGLLSALLMFNALWADLIILPAVLIMVKPKFK